MGIWKKEKGEVVVERGNAGNWGRGVRRKGEGYGIREEKKEKKSNEHYVISGTQ